MSKTITVTWKLLDPSVDEACASDRHDPPVPADWRMESGGVGSYYCCECRHMIMRGPRLEPAPTLAEAIDAARGGPAPTPKIGYS